MEAYLSMLTNEVQPGTDVVLHIGDLRWLMPLTDAYLVSSLLNSASRVATEYHKSGYLEHICAPDARAKISPVTGRDRLLWDTNEKTISEKS